MILKKLFLALFYFMGYSVAILKSANALLVVQLDPNSSINHLQYIISYQFENDKIISVDTIIAIPLYRKDVKGDYVRFDVGTNRIYQDRYLINGNGNIIDIKKKKLLLDQKNQFVKFSGDSVIFYTNDIFKGKYYSVYDLKKETYTKVEDFLYKANIGGNIESDCTEKPCKIWSYDVNDKKEMVVSDAGDVAVRCVNRNSIPFIWLDNSNFLYAKTSLNSERSQVFKISLNGGEELVGEVDRFQANSIVNFYQDEMGKIILTASRTSYLVDVEKKNVSKIIYTPIGNSFSVEFEENPEYGKKILDHEHVVGKYYCSTKDVKATNEMLALPYEMVVSHDRYPQGLMLWNRNKKNWTRFDIPDISSVIGWVSLK